MTKIKDKTCLVTGGAGFIGSHLADKLVEMGNKVKVVDNLSTGKKENVPEKAEFFKLDLKERGSVKRLKKLLKEVEYVFHTAAQSSTMYSYEHPLENHDSNVTGTLHLLVACAGSEIEKVVHSSSAAVYGEPFESPFDEETPPRPKIPYEYSKYMQELYFEMYAGMYDLPCIMLRYFSVYGSDRQSEKGPYPNVLAAFRKARREKNKVFVTGDGKQTRDFCHVFDVVRANIMAARSDYRDAERFNIASGEPRSILEVAKMYGVPVEFIPERPGETKHLYADISKAKKLLGWEPRIPFEEGLKKYLKED